MIIATISTTTVSLIAVSAIASSSLGSAAVSSTTAVREGGSFPRLTVARLGMLGSAQQCTLESRKVITITSLTTVSTIAVSAIPISSSQQLDGQQLDDSRQGGGGRHHLHHD